MDIARRKQLKKQCKHRLKFARDRLAERQDMQGMLLLGSLQCVCWAAGKETEWIYEHLYAMADRIPGLSTYNRVW